MADSTLPASCATLDRIVYAGSHHGSTAVKGEDTKHPTIPQKAPTATQLRAQHQKFQKIVPPYAAPEGGGFRFGNCTRRLPPAL